jgi:hypothetical protein
MDWGMKKTFWFHEQARPMGKTLFSLPIHGRKTNRLVASK